MNSSVPIDARGWTGSRNESEEERDSKSPQNLSQTPDNVIWSVDGDAADESLGHVIEMVTAWDRTRGNFRASKPVKSE